jgi:S1-C subfamily serine protease
VVRVRKETRIRSRDIILRMGDTRISSVDDLHRFLDEYPVGESCEMGIARNGEAMTLIVTPDELASQE